ncbi:MAG: NAD-dependent epimerase/dehydratase family protein [Lautropia sp.]|nr:NAD-dependent epimerase/dehydratase family protein [Lautropia sp.]
MDVSSLIAGRKARWLVTGAAGFIGSHLAESLTLAGQEVIAIDDFSTGKKANIDAIMASTQAAGQHGLSFHEGSICDRDFCHRVVEGVDYVLHQAALGSVPRSMKTPLVSYHANVTGFVEILDAARLANVKSFVYASSSSVYGDSPTLPKVEDVTGRVLSPYAATKASNELFAYTWARCYGMRVAGMRYFNVFGARQDPNGAYAAVIPRWIATLLREEAVQINGDGETSRDFCFIDNVVQANIRAALTLAGDEPGSFEVFNVAAANRTTLLQLADMLKKLIHELKPDLKMPDPEFRDFRPGDVRHSLADISHSGNRIGYVPSHSLEQGLRVALPWYIANNG